MAHIAALQKWLQTNHYDVAYISDFKDVQYFTGFGSDPIERVLGLFVFADAEPFLFTPALEVEAAKKTKWNHPVFGYLDHEDAFALIADHIKHSCPNPKRFAVVKDNLPLKRFEQLKSHFPTADFSGDLTSFIQHEKLFKTADEIEKLKIAGQYADKCFEIGFNALQQDRSEQDVVAIIEYEMKKQGIMHMSFDTIVQTGANAADPHGAAKATKIQPNALTLFDLGVDYHGYMSDASRTVAFGEVDAKQKEIYQVCLEAQLAAQAAAKPGVTAEELDRIARDIITKAGYGEYFIHRLGHGLGQSDHEFPSIMEGNTMELQPGMCFSIEPGIYIPNFAGVRIEDCVYVTETGVEPFTHTDKQLKTLPLK